MIGQKKTQIKRTESWEQIKARLNENLYKRNPNTVDFDLNSDTTQQKYLQKKKDSHDNLYAQ